MTATSNFEPVRVGLVGYGTGGRWFHAPLIAAAPECDFVGVVTSSAERRALLRADHAEVQAVGNLRELVEIGAEAVAISTPAGTHTALTEEALALGLAVVCDKPFAIDAASARHTVELARDLGTIAVPFQNRRWDSDFLTVKMLLAAGRLGAITSFESRFERYAPDRGPGTAGGGVLLDFGSHVVDQALVLFGPVHSVYCEYRVRDNGLDDDVFIAVTHRDGVRSHLWGSFSQQAPGLRFRVTGSEAAYVVEGPMDGQEAALRAGSSPAHDGNWGTEPEHRWGRVISGEESAIVPTVPGAWQEFYPAFARAVRGIGEVPVDVADAVVTARVLDAARESGRRGELVRLDV
jgi:predicted dehydrogenase